MSVYLVAKGEYGEGQLPHAAFERLPAALNYILEEFGTSVMRVDQDRWMSSTNGCDEVWIYRLAVQS